MHIIISGSKKKTIPLAVPRSSLNYFDWHLEKLFNISKLTDLQSAAVLNYSIDESKLKL